MIRSSTEYQAWRARVDFLLENRPADVADSLCLIAEGMELRRCLEREESSGEQRPGQERGEILGRVCLLQQAVATGLGPLRPFMPEHEVISHCLERLVEAEGRALDSLVADVSTSSFTRARLLASFHADLEWWQGVAFLLEGEALPSPFAAPRIQLHRLVSLADEEASSTARIGLEEPLRLRVERLEEILLERRVANALSAPVDDSSPERLWARRFHLSRLRDEILSIRERDFSRETSGLLASNLGTLDARRERFANLAMVRITEMPPAALQESWDEIIHHALGEANEIVTLVEDAPLPRAVRVLETARDDFRELARSTRVLVAKSRAEKTDTNRLRRQCRRALGLSRRMRDELQERRLACRMEHALGRTFVVVLENLVLALILAMTVMIGSEALLEWSVGATVGQLRIFAWADLAICSVFLSELALKLWFVEGRWLYFRRHFLVDFLASLPFGFFTFHLSLGEAAIESSPQLLRLLRFFRLPTLARYVRVAQPLIRFARLALFALRFTDHVVRRSGSVINRNIILFEPEQEDLSHRRYLHTLISLRERHARWSTEVYSSLRPRERGDLLRLGLDDLEWSLARTPDLPRAREELTSRAARDIPVERVVERLIEMTPARLEEVMGPTFAESLARYVDLFDVPIVRRLPVIRVLIAHRERGPAEVAALAANYLGYSIQALLAMVHYAADLQATISAPIFLDRVGATLVLATARPAKRLIIFGAAVLLLSLLVWPIPLLGPIVAWINERLVRPILIVGLLCLIPLFVGVWLRKMANQAAEYCERVVEAQFASHTKRVKSRHQPVDARFLAERVVEPEVALRASDDDAFSPEDTQFVAPRLANADTLASRAFWNAEHIHEEESLFLRTIDMLYQDYLDGSLLHRSDTKTTTQLLGNLALTNYRMSNPSHGTAIEKRLQSLDLSRSAGTILGGPYLWFNFVTRGIMQQTAALLVDYNRHALPLSRLACSPREARAEYRSWLAQRLRRPAHEIPLPKPIGRFGDAPARLEGGRNARNGEFFETVDFMAIDFLIADPSRDEQIRAKYGDAVAELLLRDRRENVRRAFRTFPLHRFPLALRTVNPLTMYETYCAGGRMLWIPPRLAWWIGKQVVRSVARFRRLLAEILRPARVADEWTGVGESYAVARRKIHRMRKPAFMESLWLRARFDVEYLGLSLPFNPPLAVTTSLIDDDLEFIGASRRERIAAERIRQEHFARLEWTRYWLTELGWTGDSLKRMLAEDFPFLANRSAEVVRALVTAVVLDHDDIHTLAAAIEGMRRLIAFSLDPLADPKSLPDGLPEPFDARRPLWRRPFGGRRPEELFHLPCLPTVAPENRKRVLGYLRRHRKTSRGWMAVLLDQGGSDPHEVLRGRLREVVRRTALWSDQVIALRTIQTLTMLDVFHYCELVWELGGYGALRAERFGQSLPWRRDRKDTEVRVS